MNSKVYKVSDLRRVIKESANEFKPMKGKGVDKENKANNEKAYSESSKRAKEYDGGPKKSKELSEYPNYPNKGMQDLQYDNKLPKEFKKNVQAQMKGYTSANDEKLHKDDDTAVEHNEIPKMKERAQQFKKNRDQATLDGLTGRELDKSKVAQLRDTVFESQAPKYKYKRTVFLSEQHMLVTMPDECRVEGYKCIMEDANGTEYYVVWHEDKPEVLNKTAVNEQTNKIMSMMNFKSKEVKTTKQNRINENAVVEDMMNKVRRLMREGN